MEPTLPPLSSTGTNLSIAGMRLPLLRAAFVTLSLATVSFFSLGVPPYFQNYIENIDSETLSASSGLGLSATFYAGYQTALVVLLAIAFGIVLFGLQAAYRAMTHQPNPPTIAVVLATIAVSSIFQQTRKALRRFVNHRIYGMDVDFDEIRRREHKMEQVAH